MSVPEFNIDDIDIFMVDEYDIMCAMEGVGVKQENFFNPEEADREKRVKARKRYFATQKEKREERKARLLRFVAEEKARRAIEDGLNVEEETAGDKRMREIREWGFDQGVVIQPDPGIGGPRYLKRIKDPQNKDRQVWVFDEGE